MEVVVGIDADENAEGGRRCHGRLAEGDHW